MSRAITIAAVLWILVGGIARAAFAEERARMSEPFEITADRISYEAERDLYIAERNVHVLQQGRTLTARWVAFSKKTGVAVAEGDVELIEGPDRLNAAFMVFDVDTLQGTLYHVSLDSGSDGFRLRAEEMVRTGKDTFTVHDGVFTTCRCEPGKRLPWEIETGRSDVELGGYGRMRNSTFNVLGVPVLWIPWMVIPIKSERESGLLLPSFTFGGRGGPGFGIPFFWAALPQLNVTLTPRYFVNRGYKRDFIDVVAILRRGTPLSAMIAWALVDLPGMTAETILRSLAWRDDADLQPEPDGISLAEWHQILVELDNAIRGVVGDRG